MISSYKRIEDSKLLQCYWTLKRLSVRSGLIYKLISIGVPWQLINVIKSYLFKKKFYIKIGDSRSINRQIGTGVPQDSCFSPPPLRYVHKRHASAFNIQIGPIQISGTPDCALTDGHWPAVMLLFLSVEIHRPFN